MKMKRLEKRLLQSGLLPLRLLLLWLGHRRVSIPSSRIGTTIKYLR
jgi:hypothetical protein